MIKYKYKHQLLGVANTEKIKLELEKNNIPAEVVWKFPVLTIYCNKIIYLDFINSMTITFI